MIDPLNKRELNLCKTLAGVWVLRDWLRNALGPEPMTGLWIPTSVGGMAPGERRPTMLGKTTANLNYTAGAPAITSAVNKPASARSSPRNYSSGKCRCRFPGHRRAETAEMMDDASDRLIFVGVGKLTIYVVEKRHVVYAYGCACGTQLALAHLTQVFGRRQRRVGDLAHLAAGGADDGGRMPAHRRACQRARHPKRLIVGVRKDPIRPAICRTHHSSP